MSFTIIDNDYCHSIKTIYEPRELSTAIFDTIKYYQDYNQELKDENETLMNDALGLAHQVYKKEIEDLKRRLELSYGEFASQAEKDAYEAFEKEHMHDRLTSKYNGGRAPYLIPTGAGIGTILHVKCPICGEEKDITDTSGW